MHQRYVELKTGVDQGTVVTFGSPEHDRQAPRGLYMLFLVTQSSISEAMWVVLR
jgi:hypothetical protein